MFCLFYLFRSPQKTQALSSSGPPASVFPSLARVYCSSGSLCSAGGCCLFLDFLTSLSLSVSLTHTYTDRHTHRQTHVRTQTDTHVRTHTHTLFMWERMGPLWIKLFPCITLDKAFNISNLLCPNSDLAQAEWRAGKSQSCCRVFGVTHSFIITIP